jgi:4-methyl-5(b-hydroxyethyl)-thiazole monophosphate biosynthesis
MKKAYVFLGDGFEDVEAITPIDYLRRAGIALTVVGVFGKTATSSHGVKVSCDAALADGSAYGPGIPLPDLAILPGGPGTRKLCESEMLKALLEAMAAEGRLIGAICAAPAVVLAPLGLLRGREWTCYPGEEVPLGASVSQKRVVVDLPFITSRGPGTAEEFSFALIDALVGAGASNPIRSAVQAR